MNLPLFSGQGERIELWCRGAFFATVNRELVIFENFLMKEEAKANIFEYIEVFYNRQRRHSTLGCLRPVEFEEVNKVS